MGLWCNDSTGSLGLSDGGLIPSRPTICRNGPGEWILDCQSSDVGAKPTYGANGSVAHRLEHLPDKTKAAQLPYKEIVEKVSGREFNSPHSHIGV